MNSLIAVFQREIRAYFVSPLAWVVLTIFLGVQGFIFSFIVGSLADPRSVAGITPFDVFFSNLFFWIIFLFITPVVTMRLIAEERRSGTVETLMTGPVSETQIVLAKFFAALVFYAFLWLPTLIYPVLVGRYSTIDWGPLGTGYLGTLLIGGMALAIGLFGSSLAKNQIVAAVTTFGMLIFFWAFPLAGSLLNNETVGAALAHMNLPDHMDEFAKGVVDSRRLVYYLSTIGIFLFLTTRTLAARKWR